MAGSTRMTLFQSTPSQRGRPLNPALHRMGLQHFNPRPRKEGDYTKSLGALPQKWISIHALAKRATYRFKYTSVEILNFNPRPRKEGDILTNTPKSKKKVFQSTPSQRGRQDGDDWKHPYDIISIHALAKRATVHPRKLDLYKILFQSTPSQRGRLSEALQIFFKLAISIHALAKRATDGDDWKHPYDIISIHALAKRATIHQQIHRKAWIYFNPRPRKEGDPCLCENCVIVLYFNPRPRKEGDNLH